jgi:hypothetical protein
VVPVLWLLFLYWAAFYWGTVFVVGGLIAWGIHRRRHVFLLGAVVSVGVALPFWGPWIPTDSGTAITIGWLAGASVGLASRLQQRRDLGAV